MSKILPNLFVIIFVISISSFMNAQDKLPFRSISEYPANYKAGNIVVRMIQGLGYRYHWATEGLESEDLKYRPSPEAMSVYETLIHIHGLSKTIYNTTSSKPNSRPYKNVPEDFKSIRIATLDYLEKAANSFFDKSSQEISEMKIIFDSNGKIRSFPLWNLLNGQIADVIYHTGQIVSFRRTTGNSIEKGVNVFIGKTKEF